MRRPLIYAFLVFLLSLIVNRYYQCPFFIAVLLIVSGAILCVILRYFKVPWVFAVLLLIFGLGLGYSQLREPAGLEYQWVEDVVYTVKGNVVGFPWYTEKTLSFEFNVDSVDGVTEDFKILVIADKDEVVAYGDVLLLTGCALFGNENVNPGGFDFLRYQEDKGIEKTFSTKYNGSITPTHQKETTTIMNIAAWLRFNFYESLAYLPQSQQEFIGGVFLGDTAGLSQPVLDVLSKSGIRHCFSVSGLHVGYLVVFLDLLFSVLRISRRKKIIFMLPALVIYCALTCFYPAVIRASVMCFMVYFAMRCGRPGDGFSALAAAGFLLLLWNPNNLWMAGFQLSFVAMLSIVYFTPYLMRLIKRDFFGKSALVVTVAAQIGMLPIIAYYFHLVSVISLFINSIVCFFVGGVVIFSMVGLVLSLFSAFLGAAPLVVAGMIGDFIYWGVHHLIKLNFSYYYCASFALWILLLAYAVLFIIPQLRFLRYRPIVSMGSIFIVLIMIAFPWQVIQKQGFEITFLSIGEGDCIFISTPDGKNILVDAGSGKGDSIAVNRIRPFLLDKGINRLDYIFISHCDLDHAGSVPYLLDFFGAEKIVFTRAERVFSGELEEVAEYYGTEVMKVETGDSLKIGNVDFEVMYPDKGIEGEANTLSMVLKITYQNFSVLLTGDADKGAIDAMIGENNDLDADILKIPHHGSRTGYSADFYQMVDPSSVVVSVGKNAYGHPAQILLDYWRIRDTPLYRTDYDGAVTVTSDGNGYNVSTYLHE